MNRFFRSTAGGRLPLLTVMVTAGVLCSSLAAMADTEIKIPPGQEERVMALLKPLKPGETIIPEWKLTDVLIDKDSITVALEGPEVKAAYVLSNELEREALFTTESFGVVLREGPLDAETRERLTAALEKLLTANDSGAWWEPYRTGIATPRQQKAAVQFDPSQPPNWKKLLNTRTILLIVFGGLFLVFLIFSLRGGKPEEKIETDGEPSDENKDT
jgi:hypothetical protein